MCYFKAGLRDAKVRSNQFDAAYDLHCDHTKSHLVSCDSSATVSDFARELGYEVHDTLSLLGLRVPVDGRSGPSLKDFSLQRVQRRIRLIGIAVRGLARKARFLKMMVIPSLNWAGGFANVSSEAMEGILAAFRQMLYTDLSQETPPVLLYELAGCELHPQFACELAALREAVRLQSRLPPWLEDASLRLATKRWPALLPVTTAVLTDLGWQWDPRGCYILRRDSYGQERRFELGVDSSEILVEWLRDVHRRRMLARCGRVVESLHRADDGDDLAQGLSLPPPPLGTLATFDGHKEAWLKAADTVARQSALVVLCGIRGRSSRGKLGRRFGVFAAGGSPQGRTFCGARRRWQ